MGLSQFSHGNIGFTGRDRDLLFVGRIVVRSALAIRNLHLIFRQSSPHHLFGGDYFGHYPAVCTCGLQMTLTVNVCVVEILPMTDRTPYELVTEVGKLFGSQLQESIDTPRHVPAWSQYRAPGSMVVDAFVCLMRLPLDCQKKK